MGVIGALLYAFVATKHALATISLPVFVVYFSVLVKARHETPFDSTFFYIARHCAVIDIIALVHSYLFVVLPRHGILMKHYMVVNSTSVCWGAMATYGVNITMHFVNSQTFGVILMSAHRFTAVMAPTRHKSWWDSYRTNVYLSVVWLGPLLLQLPSIVLGIDCWVSNTTTIDDSEEKYWIRFAFNSSWTQQFQFLVIMLKLVVAGFIITICYVFTFANMYRRHRRLHQSANPQGGANARAARWELRTTIVAGANFVAIIMCIIFNIRGNIGHFKGEPPADVLDEWLSDCVPCASTFVSPYLLLLLSRQFRRRFTAFISCCSPQRIDEHSSHAFSITDRQPRNSAAVRQENEESIPLRSTSL